MTDYRVSDRELAEAVRRHLPSGAPADLRERIVERAGTADQARKLWGPLAWLPALEPAARQQLVLIAALLLLAVAIAAGAIVGTSRPPEPALTWTPSSLNQDWPVPIRAEPDGEAALVRRLDTDLGHRDLRNETGSIALPWLDIEQVRLAGGQPTNTRHGVIWSAEIDLAADIPVPVPGPTERWIAYGLVLDTNGDGVPDARLGIDNMPVSEPGHRAWRTDLATGATTSAAGAPYGLVGGRYVDTWFPGESAGDVARFSVGLRKDELVFRVYTWASMIESGRVVATDYAPDVGWLERGADTTP